MRSSCCNKYYYFTFFFCVIHKSKNFLLFFASKCCCGWPFWFWDLCFEAFDVLCLPQLKRFRRLNSEVRNLSNSFSHFFCFQSTLCRLHEFFSIKFRFFQRFSSLIFLQHSATHWLSGRHCRYFFTFLFFCCFVRRILLDIVENFLSLFILC